MNAASMKNLFPNGITGLIYDCDGVMIDSAAANRYLYNCILAKLGLPALSPDQERQAFQATFQQALKWLVPQELHNQLENVCKTAIDYDGDVLPKIKLMPGYREFIDKVHAKGLKQAVDTNRTDPGIHKVLDFFKLPNYFDPVISCDICEPKPSPQGTQKIAAAWQATPAQMLFIGDSPDDRSAAKSAGAIFAGFGGIEGDLTVNSWEELADFLGIN